MNGLRDSFSSCRPLRDLIILMKLTSYATKITNTLTHAYIYTRHDLIIDFYLDRYIANDFDLLFNITIW